MKYLITFIAFLILGFGYSQTQLRKSSISSDGGSASSGNLYMVYAVGEVGVQEKTQGDLHLSEGFIGSDIAGLLSSIEDYTQLNGVSIYPNPVKTFVNIELPEYKDYEIHLFDITGKEVMTKIIKNKDQAKYDLSNFSTGIYLLSVVDHENKQFVTVKLQKL